MDFNQNYKESKNFDTSINNYYLKKNSKNNVDPIKQFCKSPEFKIFCNIRDYIIMLALSLVGLLIMYVFIKIIDSKTKYHLIKSFKYTK